MVQPVEPALFAHSDGRRRFDFPRQFLNGPKAIFPMEKNFYCDCKSFVQSESEWKSPSQGKLNQHIIVGKKSRGRENRTGNNWSMGNTREWIKWGKYDSWKNQTSKVAGPQHSSIPIRLPHLFRSLHISISFPPFSSSYSFCFIIVIVLVRHHQSFGCNAIELNVTKLERRWKIIFLYILQYINYFIYFIFFLYIIDKY